MGSATFAGISAILLLCLTLRGCEATGPFDAAKALALARDAATGHVGPDVKIFNVVDFGAKGDANTDNFMFFMRTFRQACAFNGNAMMVIPDGHFIVARPLVLSGPCMNTSPLIIQVNGNVIASSDLSLFGYPNKDVEEWIKFQNIDGLILTGRGTFDGKGAEAWKKIVGDDGKKTDSDRLPSSIMFNSVNDVIVRGLTSIDPKGFHFFITQCDNFRMFNLKLFAPASSPNTDGIHISKSSRVKISTSVIATGDDCVSMIQGSTNISITKVFCGPGHGISIGSLGHYPAEKDVSGIIVKNCTFTETDNGLRIKTYRNMEPSKATAIAFQDIIMTRVHNPIIIDQEYGTRGGSTASEVSIKDVFYTNIRGTTITKDAVRLICSSKHPCENIHLNNVNLQYEGPQNDHPFISNCANAKVIYRGSQSPPPCRS